MTYARKVDANQPEIVKAFRTLGATVKTMHTVGGGFPDLCVAVPGKTFLVEIKDGSKPPSARELTPDQVTFHATWPDKIEIVTSVDDVARIMGAKS